MTEVTQVQALIDLIVKLIRAFSTIGSVFGEIITFIINLGLNMFNIELPPVFGNAIIVISSLLFVMYSIAKNLKFIYVMFGIIIALMGVGGFLQYFNII